MNREEIEDRLDKYDLKVASLLKRVAAFVVDEILISVIIFAIVFNKLDENSNTEDIILITDSMFLPIILSKIAYHTIFVHFYGATLGKMLFSIYVVDISTDDVDRPSLAKSLVRAFVRTASSIILYMNLLFAIKDEFKQTTHDKLAQSVVVEISNS